MKRLKSTTRTLNRKPVMKEQYFAFMQTIFDNDHTEKVPEEDIKPGKLCWYLPHFGVYQPRKPDKIRVVFYSAALCDGLSLNKLLLSGPDITNNLFGVLLRFRENPGVCIKSIDKIQHFLENCVLLHFMLKTHFAKFLRILVNYVLP